MFDVVWRQKWRVIVVGRYTCLLATERRQGAEWFLDSLSLQGVQGTRESDSGGNLKTFKVPG